MQLNLALGILSTLTFLLPVILILFFKLYNHVSFFALLVYYFNSALYNLMTEGILKVPLNFERMFGAYCNYLDAILMLTVLLLFCINKINKSVIYVTLILYVIYQVFIYLYFGLDFASNIYTTGPGIALVLLYGTYMFYNQLKLTFDKNKGYGKSVMIAALLFAYGSYALIYVLHYIQRVPQVGEIFIIYFVSSIISSIIMAFGIYLISKRYQQLKELQIMRKELRLFFKLDMHN